MAKNVSVKPTSIEDFVKSCEAFEVSNARTICTVYKGERFSVDVNHPPIGIPVKIVGVWYHQIDKSEKVKMYEYEFLG